MNAASSWDCHKHWESKQWPDPNPPGRLNSFPCMPSPAKLPISSRTVLKSFNRAPQGMFSTMESVDCAATIYPVVLKPHTAQNNVWSSYPKSPDKQRSIRMHPIGFNSYGMHRTSAAKGQNVSARSPNRSQVFIKCSEPIRSISWCETTRATSEIMEASVWQSLRSVPDLKPMNSNVGRCGSVGDCIKSVIP